MNVRLKFKLKLIIFSVFMMSYFCINYINLRYNKELKHNLYHDQINKAKFVNSEIHSQILNETLRITETARKNTNIVKGSKNKFTCLERNNYDNAKNTIDCGDKLTIDVISRNSNTFMIDFEVYLDEIPLNINRDDKKSYLLVYSMESEPHSSGGTTWSNADFIMYYHLDRSYPAPATYFDMNGFLPDLVAHPRVDFLDKIKDAPIVWVLSNCGAFNEREKYVEQLMKIIKVDSFGRCLRNRNDHTQTRMSGNVELYSKYKFVIAIENSNCEDYVTEKLVHAVASGSIPIVAGRDNKPDYLRFMPNGSFINIYDYKSVQDLASHLIYLSKNRFAYEKYIHFKFGHDFSRQSFVGKPLEEVIKIAKQVIGPKERFFQEIVAKEKSESKICKLAKYLRDTPKETIDREIKKRQMKRPDISEACLPRGNLNTDLLMSNNQKL